MKLMAVESWDDSIIVGFIDEGTTCSRFISEKGQEPKILKNAAFKKENYKSIDEFVAIMGKFLPDYVFLDSPVKIDSLKYEDLIDVAMEKFPYLGASEETTPGETPTPEAGSKQVQPEQVPIPDDEDGDDVNYAKP